MHETVSTIILLKGIANDFSMVVQNVMVVRDFERCPEGEGEPIERYVAGVFDRVARVVARVNPSKLDLLVVRSDDLQGVVWGSQNLFDGRLNEALKKVGRKETCLKDGGYCMGGAVSEDDLVRKAEGFLKVPSVEFNYLTPARELGHGFVAYYLKQTSD